MSDELQFTGVELVLSLNSVGDISVQALVPITIEMEVPFDFHGQLIGQKGKEIRQIMEECDVTISIPKPNDMSDIIKITGAPAKIPHAREVIQRKIKLLEEERTQKVCCIISFIMINLNTCLMGY